MLFRVLSVALLFRVLSVDDGTVYMCTRINSMKRLASGAGNLSDVRADVTGRGIARSRTRGGHCVSAVRAVEVTVF